MQVRPTLSAPYVTFSHPPPRRASIRSSTHLGATPGKLLICDLPTTLTAVFDAIEMYLAKGHIGKSKEQELIEARELSNFVAVVKAKVAEDPFQPEIGEIHPRITAIKRPGKRGQAYNRDREGKGVSSATQCAGIIEIHNYKNCQSQPSIA